MRKHSCSTFIVASNFQILFGNSGQIGIQALVVVVAASYTFIVTFVIVWIINRTVGFRETEGKECLDLAESGEIGHVD